MTASHLAGPKRSAEPKEDPQLDPGQTDYPEELISSTEMDQPLAPGELPEGREEERRGHALENDPDPGSGVKDTPIGRDKNTRGAQGG